MWFNVVAICVKKTSVVPAGTCLQLRCWWIITRVWRVKWKLEAGAPWSVSRWAKHCWLLETQQLKRWDERYYNHYKHCFIVWTTCPLQNSSHSLRMAWVRPDAYKLIFGAPKVLFTAHYIPLCLSWIKILEPWTLFTCIIYFPSLLKTC